MRPATRRSLVPIVVAALLAARAALAQEDLVLRYEAPGPGAFGSYAGSARLAVGEIRDEGFAEDSSHLGMGPQAVYQVECEGSRESIVRAAVTHFLTDARLVANGPGEAAFTVDVVIRRLRYTTHQTAGRFRLRLESFVEFVFRRGDEVAGRVLACGNSETYAQFASQKKIAETVRAGLDDTLFKLATSGTLARLVGPGWTPKSPPDKRGEYEITRIHRDEYYGPTDAISREIPAATSRMGSPRRPRRVYLPEFAITEPEETRRPELARRFVPGSIAEHLAAFFPGALDVVPGPPPAQGSGVVVAGTLDRFQFGNVALRVLVGFGAGKDKLDGKIALRDAASGETIHEFAFLSSNWGGGWQFKRGQVRDMADQLARDVAFLLVRTLAPDYTPPADLEIRFDGIPYPAPQRK